MIKHKARLYIHGRKQIKRIDFWNTYAPVVQATTTRLMLILHQVNNWKCRHLDYVLAFTQAPTDTDVFLRIPAGFHVENEDGVDITDSYCLKLLKNCYGTKDAAANWFAVLQKALEDRGFQQCTDIDPCLFTRSDCIIITYVDDCLIFYKNDEIFKELIKSLEDEFKLTDEGDLETFLGVLFKKQGHNKLELTQPHLIQRIIDALNLQDDSKMHDTPANVTLHRDENGKKRV